MVLIDNTINLLHTYNDNVFSYMYIRSNDSCLNHTLFTNMYMVSNLKSKISESEENMYKCISQSFYLVVITYKSPNVF